MLLNGQGTGFKLGDMWMPLLMFGLSKLTQKNTGEGSILPEGMGLAHLHSQLQLEAPTSPTSSRTDTSIPSLPLSANSPTLHDNASTVASDSKDFFWSSPEIHEDDTHATLGEQLREGRGGAPHLTPTAKHQLLHSTRTTGALHVS